MSVTSQIVQEAIEAKRLMYDEKGTNAEFGPETTIRIPAGVLESLLADYDALEGIVRGGMPKFMADHQSVKINPRNGEDGVRFEADDKLRQDEFTDMAVFDAAELHYLQDDAVVWSDLTTADAITSWLPGKTWGEVVAQHPTLAAFPDDPWNTSLKDETVHRLVLDIDFGAALVASSTPGHFHLYLDKLLPWSKARETIEALGKAGILEPGYVIACVERGYATVRLPWVHKVVKS